MKSIVVEFIILTKKFKNRLLSLIKGERSFSCLKSVKDERYLLAQMRILAHVAQKNLEISSLKEKPIYFSFYLQLQGVLGDLSCLNLNSVTYEWAKQVCLKYKRRFDREP